MYCKECGKQIDDDSKFCRYCGFKQPDSEADIRNIEEKNINVNISLFGKKTTEKQNKLKEPTIKESRFDPNYQRPYWISIIGVLMVIAYSVLSYLVYDEYIYEDGYIIISIISIILKIGFTIQVVKIADNQNRNTVFWGIFGFFITGLALIIIGLLPKLKDQSANLESIPETKPEYAITSKKRFRTLFKIVIYVGLLFVFTIGVLLILSIWGYIDMEYIWVRIFKTFIIYIFSSGIILLIANFIYPKK